VRRLLRARKRNDRHLARWFAVVVSALPTLTLGLPATASAEPPPEPPPRPVVFRGSQAVWHYRSTLTTGIGEASRRYGDPGDVPLMCDWDGDGDRTPGVRRGIVFHLVNSLDNGIADTSVPFGDPFDVPICGDWDGDGDDTIGVYRGGDWYLREHNGPGATITDFQFGEPFILCIIFDSFLPPPTHSYCRPEDYPVVGDWDGDGDDNPGVLRRGQPPEWRLRDSNSAGPPTTVPFTFGDFEDLPLAGDWDGDGTDTAGLWRWGQWFLRNANSTGPAAGAFVYGDDTDHALIW
jgi:hypothetical protein